MADNPTIDNGALTDYTVSTDEGTGGHVQRVKLAYSADGSETHVTADADGLLVNLGANNDVTVSGVSTAANQSTIIGHLDGVEGLLGTIDADTGAMATDLAAIEVLLGTIDADTGSIATAASTIAGAVSGTEMQVDVLTMPTVAVTGTFYQATQPVSAASLPLPSGAATAAKQPALGTAGAPSADVISIQGVASGTVVPVSDGGGALTVDGTVTANAGSGPWPVTDNGGSLTVDAPVGTPVFVRLSDGAAAITTLPVSLASVPSHAVTNAGTFAVQVDGAALAALQLIDNPVVVDDAAFTPASTSVMMAGFEYDDTTPDSVNEGDAGAARMSANRNVYVQIRDAAGNERGLNVDASGNIGVGTHAVTQSGTWNVTNVSGTVSLPTGASTAANQTTIIGHLDGVEGLLTTIDADTGTLAGAVSGTEMQVDVVGALPAGTNAIGKLAANSGVDIGDVDVTSVVPGTSATSLGKAIDAAAGASDTGVAALAVRDDALSTLTPAEGDWAPLRVDSTGAQWVAIASGSVTASGSISVEGQAAHDADGTGSDPVLIGGYASAAAPTSVSADNDAVRAWFLRNGAQATVLTAAGALIGGDATNGIDVDVTRVTGTVTTSSAGDVAHDTADSGNPVKVGFKAANALPTAVANSDRANGISDLWGRQLTGHIDPAMQVHKVVNVTTQQTGSDVWSPTSGKKIAVTSVVIGSYGTTAGRVILWFGDNADTTYSAGTDQVLVAASFAPSTSAKPGLVYTPAVPVFCTTADRELHLTTDAAISLDITIEGYEW